MPIPASGQLSLTIIKTEFAPSDPNPLNLSSYYRGGAYVTNVSTTQTIPTSGQIAYSNFYNTSAQAALSLSTATVSNSETATNNSFSVTVTLNRANDLGSSITVTCLAYVGGVRNATYDRTVTITNGSTSGTSTAVSLAKTVKDGGASNTSTIYYTTSSAQVVGTPTSNTLTYNQNFVLAIQSVSLTNNSQTTTNELSITVTLNYTNTTGASLTFLCQATVNGIRDINGDVNVIVPNGSISGTFNNGITAKDRTTGTPNNNTWVSTATRAGYTSVASNQINYSTQYYLDISSVSLSYTNGPGTNTISLTLNLSGANVTGNTLSFTLLGYSNGVRNSAFDVPLNIAPGASSATWGPTVYQKTGVTYSPSQQSLYHTVSAAGWTTRTSSTINYYSEYPLVQTVTHSVSLSGSTYTVTVNANLYGTNRYGGTMTMDPKIYASTTTGGPFNLVADSAPNISIGTSSSSGSSVYTLTGTTTIYIKHSVVGLTPVFAETPQTSTYLQVKI
jgi:hypothetical protein